jgi:hypothetical protein
MRNLILLSLSILSCGTAAVEAKNYDLTCTQDSDCAPVYFGDVCKSCFCANGAINVKSSAKYASDLKESKKYCGAVTEIGCAQCLAPVSQCVGSSCKLK